MRQLPPTSASICCTCPVKPCGGSHLHLAAGVRTARSILSGDERRTRCRRSVDMVAVLPALATLSLDGVRPLPEAEAMLPLPEPDPVLPLPEEAAVPAPIVLSVVLGAALAMVLLEPPDGVPEPPPLESALLVLLL